MSEKKLPKDKKANVDWFAQGILAKIGDIFDKMTGRGWQNASSLTTSELSERLKKLLDSEVKDFGAKGKFVPHHINLKMQWNKFSTDSEDALKKLEYELLAAAIDHINDNLYHTYKPLKIEVKPDYFTEGIKFLASFDEFGEEEAEAEINVTAPQIKIPVSIPVTAEPFAEGETYIAEFTVDGKRKVFELKFNQSKKRNSVGRTKENDLCIEDVSISKIHAALLLNPDKKLLVADTGSTNGTFINESRIAYGRAFPVGENDKLKFGTVEVFLRRVPKTTDFATREQYEVETPPPTEAQQLPPQPTVASLPLVQANQLPSNNVANEEVNPTISAKQMIPQQTVASQQIQPPTVAVEQFATNNQPNESEIIKTEPAIKLNFDNEEKS
ncbi:MAG: FHA domain-containing protein [Pyrinomonadaceae bacterium]|nr:FHA domain-containing protein [Pyrinomonadaceae bacterium]